MATRLLDIIDSVSGRFDGDRVRGAPAVVGFDGFVDEMASVIGARKGDGGVEFVPTIAAFGAMVSAAAGRSFGREVRVKRVEAGGNAPNLAGGLAALGLAVDFYGTLGEPRDPVFDAFAAKCRSCTTLGACGRTLALEFDDGKLMLNNTGRLGELTREVAEHAVRAKGLGDRCNGARLVGLANWSRYPHMTACWRVVLESALAHASGRPWVIVDLADPTGWSAGDVRELGELLARMAGTCRVVFGANLSETGVLLRAFDASAPSEEPASMMDGAERLRGLLGVQMVAVHSQRRAAAAWSGLAGEPDSRSCIEGAYNPRPVRTTGVGDRFNAGLGAGLLAGMAPADALALGCGAGAWFVSVGEELRADQVGGVGARLRSLGLS